ncbi:AAA family ATPase [Porphyromonas cangingivalis]|nr:ATP-dependent Clp protease ATP-binding subunit [Porphyromonas cangingivalis]
MMRIAQILCRKKKNNPILLGDPGVGKTAIVEALAQRIEEKKVPIALMDKKIVSLDLASLVAGSMYRGQFEERLKTVISELKEHPEIILYIDEIHTIMGSGNPEGGLDAANILKPALARGEVRCIGATTMEEYRKSIEKDGAMDRRFQKVVVAATDEAETLNILRRLRPTYEKFHKVKYTDEALEACVKLTARYVTERQFPDKAIDALDESGAHTFIMHQAEPTRISDLEERLKTVHEAKLLAVKNLDYELATKYRDEEKVAREELDKYIEDLKNGVETAAPLIVDVDTVEKVVSLSTGLPLESLTRDDLKNLSGLSERLSARVIGQDHVVSDISSAIQRNKVGLRNPSRPIGTFLFLGSSGVGKTHLSKQIARELFGSENA